MPRVITRVAVPWVSRRVVVSRVSRRVAVSRVSRRAVDLPEGNSLAKKCVISDNKTYNQLQVDHCNVI